MPASRSTPVRIVVVAEAEADQRMVCGLIDRKIAHHAPDWFDHENTVEELTALREWCGLAPGSHFTRWNRLKELARQTESNKAPGARVIGFGSRRTHGYDWSSLRAAIIHFERLHPQADALVVSRDLDKSCSEERLASLEEGERVAVERGVHLVMAIQTPMREAWLLNGFIAKSQREREVLASELEMVRFDPCCKAEDMDVADETAPRSAKRALRALTNGNAEREEACWRDSDWQLLRERGIATRLKAFLNDVRDRLVQLVTGEPPR